MDKFIEARRTYQKLYSQYIAGKLTKASFQEAVERLVVLDPFGDQWQIGVSSGDWYRFDGSQWVKDYPPPMDIGSAERSASPLAGASLLEGASSDLEMATASFGEDKTEIGLSPVGRDRFWQLIVERGNSLGRRFPIDQELVLGRDPRNNAPLDDNKASRKHAIIRKLGQEVVLSDQNSTNGTYLNGVRIQRPEKLKPGDQIQIGDTQIRVEGGFAEEPATMVAQAPPEMPLQPPVVSAPPPVYQQTSPPPTVVQPAQPKPYQPPPPMALPTRPPKQKRRRGCTCLIVGLLILIVTAACLAALIFGGVIMVPDVLQPFIDSSQAPVVVENYSDYEICYVFMSPSSSTGWGGDLLGETETILPGANRTFWISLADSIDMQVQDCNQNLLNAQYDVPLTIDGLTYTITNP